MRPNDDLRDCLSGAAGLVRDGLHNYRNYVLSALGKARSLSDAVCRHEQQHPRVLFGASHGNNAACGAGAGHRRTHACEAVVAPVLESALATPVG